MKSLKELDSIDWDFEKDRTNTSTHSFHPYPAKYIPQLPNKLITELSAEGETVYDPFVESLHIEEETQAGQNVVALK